VVVILDCGLLRSIKTQGSNPYPETSIMARESRRKREQKRFGTTSRLADLIGSEPWANVSKIDSRGQPEWTMCEREHLVERCCQYIIDVTNVHDYIIELQDKGEEAVGWKEMILDAIPPFESCFVEMHVPPDVSPQIVGIGWLLESFGSGEEPQFAYDALMRMPSSSAYSKCHRFVIGSMVIRIRESPGSENCGMLFPTLQSMVMLDKAGCSIQPPFTAFNQSWCDNHQDDWIAFWGSHSFFIAMLAFRFLNRKDVRLAENNPDPGVNRERRKAGLKPFLRYHTIDIDPRKLTLHAEGDIGPLLDRAG
jgi:hypothetical protein